MIKRAFTLIELLVVIAIIAVLMAILMPALRAARDHAKRIHCVGNIKTLSLAWFIYKDENDDILVGGAPGQTGSGSWVLAPSGDSIEQKKDAIREGALFPYVGKTVDVYRCPADQRQRDPRQYAFRSFSIAGGANGEGWSGSVQATKYSDIRNPTTKYIFVEDIDPRGYNVGSWVMAFPPSWVDPLAMWHNEKSTMGFADGHSDMHRWHDKSFINWGHEAMYGNPLTFQFYMSAPADEREDLIFMANGYPCKSHD